MEFWLSQNHYISMLLAQLLPQLLIASSIILLVALIMGCGHTFACRKRPKNTNRSITDEA